MSFLEKQTMQAQIGITKFNLYLTDPQKVQFNSNLIVSEDFGPDTMSEIIEEVSNRTNRGLSVSNNRLSKVASSMLTYRAGGRDDQCLIGGVNWNEPRCRWELRLEMKNTLGGGKKITIINGYTDYDGFTTGIRGVSIDEDMIMYINSIRSATYNRVGSTEREIVTDSQQLLFNENKDQRRCTIRPEDILEVMSVTSKVEEIIGDSISGISIGEDDLQNIEIDDIEITTDENNVNERAINNNRKNNSITDYLGTQLNTIVESKRMEQFSGSDDDDGVYSSASESIKDKHSMADNVALWKLNQLANVLSTGKMTFGQLKSFDEYDMLNREGVVSIYEPPKGRITPADICNAEWSEATMECTIAKIVRDSLPSILIAASIDQINLELAMELDGNYELHPVPLSNDDLGQSSLDGHSLYGSTLYMLSSNELVNYEDSFEYIRKRVLEEIVPIITKNYQIVVNVRVNMHIHNDSIIGVSIEGDEEQLFNATMYSDNLNSPMIANQGSRDDKEIARLIKSTGEYIYNENKDFIDRAVSGNRGSRRNSGLTRNNNRRGFM